MAAAGCNFITPITYQTNLMVYGPGGYRIYGLPEAGCTFHIACCGPRNRVIAPQVFPFMPT